MTPAVPTRDPLVSLEDLLVQEFRTLQSLIALSKEEYLQLAKKDGAALMRLVEQKEGVLDHFCLLEESRRMLTQEAAGSLGVSLENSSLLELLPYLEAGLSSRLARLSEGIAMLASQARDLNYGNKAMATAALDWLAATQNFLFSLYQPEASYRPPGMLPKVEQTSAWEFDQRI